MEYKFKSIILGRRKRENEDTPYPAFVSFFSDNSPHTSGSEPEEIVHFPAVHKIVITGLDVSYLLEGNDLLINNLELVEVKELEGHLHISGKQTN